jgi:hypothetical protein
VSLIEAVRRQVGGGGVVSPEEVTPERVASLVVAVACGAAGPLAAAQTAAGWSQEVLAALGCRRVRPGGRRAAASASTLGRLHRHVDVEELESVLAGWAVARAAGWGGVA